MINKITPETTVAELTELIKYIQEKEQKQLVILEMYDDGLGEFYYYEGEDTRCCIVEIDEIEDYMATCEGHDYCDLKEQLESVLSEPDGMKKLISILQEII